MTSGVPGTRGWKAKELINGTPKDKITNKVDIFPAGIFLYWIMKKKHPFGNGDEKAVNMSLCQLRKIEDKIQAGRYKLHLPETDVSLINVIREGFKNNQQ